MKLFINPILAAFMGFLLASLGATLSAWQFWAAMAVCFTLIVVNGLDL